MTFNPLINYRGESAGDAQAIMADEKLEYDQMMLANGTLVTLDDEDSTEITVLRELPKAYTQSTRTALPTVDQPNRTTDIFYTQAGVEALIPRTGGSGFEYHGRRYAIQFVEPREVAGVTYLVELHCDIEDGLHMAPGAIVL